MAHAANSFPFGQVMLGIGVIAGVAWWIKSKEGQQSAVRGITQIRPMPEHIGSLPESQQRQYIATAQAQLYAMRYLTRQDQITAEMDDDTIAALQAFARADATRLQQIQSSGREASLAMDLLDQEYRRWIAQYSTQNSGTAPA